MVLPKETRAQNPPQGPVHRPPATTPVKTESPTPRASIQLPAPAPPHRSLPVSKRLAILGGTLALTALAILTIFWLRPPAPANVGISLAGATSRPTKPDASTSTKVAPGSNTDETPSPGRSTSENPVATPPPAPPIIATNLPATGHIPGSSRLKILVPAYIYPAGDGRTDWDRLIAAATKVEIVAIANPDSGPGSERNIDYATIFTEAANHGVKLVGYVSTDYGRRDVGKIKTDIDNWLRFYSQIRGFFFDQQPRDGKAVAMFSELRDYVKQKMRDPLVITNPGIPCDPAYLSKAVSNITCVFVNFEGFERFELPGALSNYDAARFAAFPYNVQTADTMRAVVKDAIVKRIGYLYISDSKPPTQWGKLPVYWEAEVEAISRVR